ncbi:TDT family transporter [Berryella wangjianweii]|uniref:TDT family transporter n=1 Tax=Berryella wangjianweii TaxID=2734634 RepID=A0A6M8J327_9ACTN|nr:TDT family transporter [Berryella wangjianweii]QKF07541.1 TDT family transporter [Berryella wangjianweii]
MNFPAEALKRVPLPVSGVALGLAALGNAVGQASPVLRLTLGCVSALLVLILLAKIACVPRFVAHELQNSILASTFATLFMTCMQLATYLAPYAYGFAFALWHASVSAHMVLIALFSVYFFSRFELTDVHATYFIAYVGIIVASLTSPTFHVEPLGAALFWFGLALYAALLVLVTVRYLLHEVKVPAKPTFCVYAAPMSLSLAGYLAIEPHPNLIMVTVMLAAAQLLFVMVLTQVPSFVRAGFFPSYAAMTFPFVITSVALGRSLEAFGAAGCHVAPWLWGLQQAETAFAFAMVMFVLISYVRYLVRCAREAWGEARAA